MSESPRESYDVLDWAPVLIGFMFSTFLYGTTFGQSIYYSHFFPNDPNLMKTLVLGTFLVDTIHMIGNAQLFWTFFALCHQRDPRSCDGKLPWGGLATTCINTIFSFTVQCFYCRRIWTISGQNRFLTLAVFILSLVGLGSGIWYNIDVARVGTIQYIFQCPLLIPISAAGSLCDILITSSVFKYMWKSGFRRRRTTIQDLAVICINMGAFTCLVSVITGIMFLSQGSSYWVAAIGMIIGQSYVNSMLAVLNARKAIRDRDITTYELSTIPL